MDQARQFRILATSAESLRSSAAELLAKRAREAAGGAVASASRGGPRPPVTRTLERGVTHVEVLIVVAIIAMVASGVAVFALPRFREAQVKSAETGARVIRGAIMNWQRVNNEVSCPTVAQLVQEKQRMMKDAWLTDTGHKRPGMNKGLPLAEAQAKAAELDKQIYQLAGPTPSP